MAESLGSASLTLAANPAPLMGGLAAAKAKTVASMKGTGAASAAAFATGMVALGAAAGVVLYKVGQTYQSAYNKIRTETGATGKKMEGLKDTFRDVFGRTPADADDVATALAEVHKRTGRVGKPLEELTLQFLRLSGATGTDAKTNIAAVTRAFEDWGVATKDQGGKLDGMFGLSQKTGISVEDLSKKMAQFGTPLRTLGFSFDESAAMFAMFEKSGVTVSTMMPGLRMALKNIAKPTSNLGKKFKALGVDTKDPQKALGTIMEKIKKMPNDTDAASFAMEVFGTRAGPDMAGAIREGKFEVGDLIKVMKNSKGAVEDNAKANATLKGRLDTLKHQGMNLLEPVAMKLTDTLTDLAGKLLKIADWIKGWPQPVKRAAGKAIMFAGGLAVLAAVISKVIGVLKMMKATLLMNPYVAIILATVAIGYLIYKNWDKIKKFLSAAWDKIKGAARWAWDGILKLIKKYWKYIALAPLGPMGLMLALMIKNWDKVKSIASGAWSAVADTITGAMGGVADKLSPVTSRIGDVMQGAWKGIKSGAKKGWGAVSTIISGYWGAILGRNDKSTRKLRKVYAEAWGAIRRVTKILWWQIKTTIVRSFTNAVDRVWDLSSHLRSRLSELWSRVRSRVSDAWQAVKSVMIAPFKSAAETIKNTAGNIPDRLKSAWRGLGGAVSKVWNAVKNGMVTPMAKAYNAIASLLGNLKTVMKSAWEYVTKKVASIWNSIKGLPSRLNPLQSAGFSAGMPTMGVSPSYTGILGSSGATSGANVQVSVTFADGMGWLKDFVDIQIDESDRAAGLAYAAGGGGY